jgi:PQQ-dependent catabolism-associated CXXCW motif protein
MRAIATCAVVNVVLNTLLVSNLAASVDPPEPQEYRMDDYRARTPAAVAGGTTLDTAAAQRLWQEERAVWIDVLAAPRRPGNFPASAVWLPVPRHDIPGSLWLPDVGRGELSPELEAYFRTNLERATNGRPDTPIVFYCLADCWMSWNAAKRAASWGYRHVFWYRDGTDGWAAANLPLAPAEPVSPSGYR